MIRGDLFTVALQGDLGKPRPDLIIQVAPFNEHPTVTLLPVTSTLVDAPLLRVTLRPSASNGLQKLSQVMVDKTTTVQRANLDMVIGHLDRHTLLEIDRRRAVFLGIAG